MNEYNCMHILGSERKNRNQEKIQKKKRHRFNIGKNRELCHLGKKHLQPFRKHVFNRKPFSFGKNSLFCSCWQSVSNKDLVKKPDNVI